MHKVAPKSVRLDAGTQHPPTSESEFRLNAIFASVEPTLKPREKKLNDYGLSVEVRYNAVDGDITAAFEDNALDLIDLIKEFESGRDGINRNRDYTAEGRDRRISELAQKVWGKAEVLFQVLDKKVNAAIAMNASAGTPMKIAMPVDAEKSAERRSRHTEIRDVARKMPDEQARRRLVMASIEAGDRSVLDAFAADPLRRSSPLVSEEFLTDALRAQRIINAPEHAVSEAAIIALKGDIDANKLTLAQRLKIPTPTDRQLRRPDGSVVANED